MKLYCSKHKKWLKTEPYNLSEVNGYIRAYINHRLYQDSETWSSAEGRDFTGNPLKDFIDRLIMFGSTKMFRYDDATTIFAFPPAYLLDHVGIEGLTALLEQLPSDMFWVENMEVIRIAYDLAIPEDLLHGLYYGCIIAKDFSEAVCILEAKYNGRIKTPINPELVSSVLGLEYYTGTDYDTKVAEIRAIEYPDFTTMLKDDLQDYIDTWNLVYPNNQIVPEGTLKADLLAAIQEKTND